MPRAVLVLVVLVSAGCVAPPAAQVAPAGPAAQPAPEPLLIAPAAGVSDGAEPTILAARDGALWVGDTSGLWRSLDAGASWSRVSVPFVRAFLGDGWTLAEDEAGTIYVGATNGHAVSLAASEDGGATWRVNHVVDASVIADRPWIAARGDGEVAFLYYDLKTTKEACLYSNDGGRTFLTRYVGLVASPNAGNAVFAPDGGLLYSSTNLIYRWDDPCVGEPRTIIHGAATGSTVFTQVAVDDEGTMYVAGPGQNNGAMVLYGKRAEGGQWRSLRVSAPETRSNTFAAISVQGGEVGVAWYGSTTPGNPASPGFRGDWHVHVARVRGFWDESPVVVRDVVTTQPNHVGDFCMAGVSCTNGDRDLLDYFGADHGPDGAFHVAYGHDGAGSNSVVRHASLAP